MVSRNRELGGSKAGNPQTGARSGAKFAKPVSLIRMRMTNCMNIFIASRVRLRGVPRGGGAVVPDVVDSTVKECDIDKGMQAANNMASKLSISTLD